MDFKPCTITVKVDEKAPLQAAGFEAVGTGLGYFIDEKPDEPEWAFTVNGTEVYREPDETRYCPTHLSSGMGFPQWFYQETHVRTFIEEISAILDWTLPLEEIAKLPAWASIFQKNNEIVQKITRVEDEQRALLENFRIEIQQGPGMA